MKESIGFDSVAGSLEDIDVEQPSTYGVPANASAHAEPKRTPSMLERIMFPDISHLPQSERILAQKGQSSSRVCSE